MTFPQTGQLANEFFVDPRDLFAGDRYAPDLNRDEVPAALIGSRAEVGQVDTVTVTWVANDQFGFVYDGVVIVATADTDDDTSALALEVSANTALAGALAGSIFSVSLATNILTVNSVAGTGAHVLTDYEPDLTTVVIAPVTAASGVAQVTFGMGVVQDASFPDLIRSAGSAVRQPLTNADAFWGVMVRQAANNFDAATMTLLGRNPNFLSQTPAAYQAIRQGRIIVPWVDALPTKGAANSVFWINDAAATPAQRGYFRSTNTNAVAVVADIERVITRPSTDGAFTGLVGINIR